MQTVSNFNPLSYAANAVRALMNTGGLIGAEESSSEGRWLAASPKTPLEVFRQNEMRPINLLFGLTKNN